MKNRWATTADIAVIALVARVALALHAHAEPVWDGFYYDLGAQRIASGHGYSEDLVIAAADGTERVAWSAWAHYPVGYSGFLALFYKLLGAGSGVAAIANALTGAALAAVVHRVALQTFLAGSASDRLPERRALAAGLITALHPGLVLYSGALMTEPLAALLMLFAIAVQPRGSAKGTVLGGISLGLATLVRPNAILLAPFLGVTGRWRSRFIRGAAIGVVALATVAPWTLRNCRVMDQCTLVSTNAGWNLVIGSAPGATGKFEFLVGHTPEGGPTCAEGGQVAQDRCWFRYGAQTIKRDTRRWLSLIPAKLHYTLDAEWFPINYLREARPDLVSARAHIVWGKALTAMLHLLVVVAALASVGWSRPARTKPPAYAIQMVLTIALLALSLRCLDPSAPSVWPLGVAACVLPFLPLPGAPKRNGTELAVAAVILTTLATHAIFFGEDRYHLVATPAFIILACGIGRRSR